MRIYIIIKNLNGIIKAFAVDSTNKIIDQYEIKKEKM